MKLLTEPYLEQVKRLPLSGRHILAQFDQESIVVYQAYNSNIGNFAANNGYFGGEFLFDRMSWIKPSFLWMMYRSGWGTKANQEVILAIWIKRSAFDNILAQTVSSGYVPELYSSKEEWQQAVKHSCVSFILHIENISSFVREQYANRLVRNQEHLLIPVQSLYSVDDSITRTKIGLLH